MFGGLYEELCHLEVLVQGYADKIESLAKGSDACQKIMKIPGVGPLTATAIVAAIGNANSFSNGRQLSAWLGLVPRQHSSGGNGCLTKA